MEINLIQHLEKISTKFPNRILKIKGYKAEKIKEEFLEIIIYKGFSSSTTHQIDIDAEKNILKFKFCFTSFELYEAPLSETNNKLIKETSNSQEISKESFWL